MQFQSDLGKEPKAILIMEFKVHSGAGSLEDRLKFLSCSIKIHLPKTVLKCGWNSIRQPQLLTGGMCKRKAKEDLRGKCTEREEGKQRGRKKENVKEGSFHLRKTARETQDPAYL